MCKCVKENKSKNKPSIKKVNQKVKISHHMNYI